MKKFLSLTLVGVLAVGAVGMSFAASPFGAAEAYSRLSGTSLEESYAAKLESSSTFGELARENGLYEPFREAMISSKLELIETMVDEGELTRDEADAIIASMENCDGTQQDLLKNRLNFGQKSGNFKNAENAARGMGGMMRRGAQNN